ncbi:MAG: hypothetical protein HYY06_05860 [Deltaproteobacteria bacterium]|nr:hypothetical protein [Deltaproteobacteria bacterium]
MAVVAVGCHRAPAHRRPITVVVAADAGHLRLVRRGLQSVREPDVELTLADPPSRLRVAAAEGDVERRLAAARRSYVDGGFDGCLDSVGTSGLVERLLGEERRALAARVLFWRIACQVGQGQPERARQDARAFATFGLAIPPDAGGTTPEVEAVLADGITEVGRADRATLWVDANLPGAASFDGGGAACRVPCAVDLPPGDHVVRVAADGAVPEARRVRLGAGGARIRLELARAGPDLAGRQWSARYGASGELDSRASLRLLAQALAAPRLVLMTTERLRSRIRLRGSLALRGDVAAQAERKVQLGELAGSSSALVVDLLERGRVVARPLWSSTLFWLAVGATATLAAGVTALILWEPNIDSTLYFAD